jgi:predicted ATP-grasp superfamily ATP-dependent carboligase
LGYYSVGSEAALLNLLHKIAALTPQRAALIAAGDGEVLFLSRNRERLEERYHFVLPDTDTVERLANKRSQYEYAQSIGIPIPPTYYPSSEWDVEQIASRIRFPCLIKPAYSHMWRDRTKDASRRQWLKAAEARTPEELRSAYRQMSESQVELLVQERIRGSDSRLYSWYVYLNRNSDPLASCVIQKLRQWPVRYGTGSYSSTCRCDDVVTLGLRLLKEIRYVGMANLEFKHDPKDGTFRLIEANVRSGERIGLAISAGVDMPYIAYRDIIGEPIDPIGDYETGVRWVNLVNDAAAFLYHYRKRTSWWRYARSLLQARSHAYFSWKDPLPFLEHVFQTSKGLGTAVYRRVKAGKPGSAKLLSR